MCKPEIFEQGGFGEATQDCIFMRGYMICLLSTRLVAIDPYAYTLQKNDKGYFRFVEDGKSFISLMTGFKNSAHACAMGNDRIAITRDDTITIFSLSSALRLKQIKTIPSINSDNISYDAFHKRLLVYQWTRLGVFTENLDHLANVYPLSNGRHCVHITPDSLYFSGHADRHPGFLWGNGDCSEIFSVTDGTGNAIVDEQEKKKIIQSYYNRSEVKNALQGNKMDTEPIDKRNCDFGSRIFQTMVGYKG